MACRRPLLRSLARLTALLAALAAGPAWAGGGVTLGCAPGSTSLGGSSWDFLVGSGRAFRGQGLELWPMLCLSSGRLGSYARVMDDAAFSRLQQLAAQAAPDKQELRDWMAAHPDEAGPLVRPDTFGQIEGLTFGDIRATVQNAARSTEEPILASRFVYWSHPTCVGRLVPFDFYLETGAPCPACGGGKLQVDEHVRHPDWD